MQLAADLLRKLMCYTQEYYQYPMYEMSRFIIITSFINIYIYIYFIKFSNIIYFIKLLFIYYYYDD